MKLIILNDLSGRDGHLPYSDDVVGVASEEGLSVSRPREGQALGWVRLGSCSLVDDLWSKLLNHFLAFQIL